jgi:osmotically-inducible protein OsmY
MNNRYDEYSRREGRERDRGRERQDDEREDERSSHEAQSRSSFYPGEYGSQESGNWGRESQPYGQREPYNTSGSGGSTYGASGYGPYRGEGGPRRGSGYYGSGYGREDFGRSRWGGPTDYGNRGSSRYSESQYGQRRPWRDTTGRDYGGGGFRSRSEDWNRDDQREYREGRYGSGDFGYEYGSRGEPSFGSGYDDGTRSPRYFGMGNYGEGGSHFTGGYDQRGQSRGSSYSSGGDDYGYQGSSRYRGGESGHRGDYSDRGESYRGESRSERPGLLQRLFKRGPKGYQRSDERLREDISERLMQSTHVDSSEVTVNVVSGKVTLEGTVPDRYMKHYIEDLVDACPGVQDIDNRVRVDPMSGQSSSTLGTTGTTGTSTTGTSTTTGASTTGLGSNGGRRKE